MGRERLHALDALRAAAMLLGIFWHAALFVRFIEGALVWPTDNRVVEFSADLLIVGLHAFRMPLFFVMAGFFAALVVARSGPRPFARARLVRIGLPLIVTYLTVIPLTRAAMILAQGKPLTLDVLVPGGLGAVWFLYYLLQFYALALLIRRLPGEWVANGFERLVRSPLRVPVLGLVTAVLLLQMATKGTATPSALTPDPLALLFYGGFFAFGWLLHGRRHLLAEVGRRPGAHLAAAAALSFALVVAARRARTDAGWEPAVAVLVGLLAWTAIYGCFGLFERVFRESRAWVRYLADASYWLYLTHGPLVIALDAVLLSAGVPLLLVILLSGLGASAVLLVVYERGVRYGAIGRVLHGPRQRSDWTDGRVSAVQPGLAPAD